MRIFAVLLLLGALISPLFSEGEAVTEKEKFVASILWLEGRKEDISRQMQSVIRKMEIYKKEFQKGGKKFRPYFYLSSLRRNLSLLHTLSEEYKNIEMEEYGIFSAYLSWAEKNWDKLSKKEKEEVKEDLENLFILLDNP